MILNKQQHKKREPAILVIESPWSVCKIDPGIFDAYPCRKIIVVDEGQSTEKYFSQDDLIISCSLMDTAQLDDVYRRLTADYRVMAVLGFNETSVFATAYLAEAFGVSGIGIEAALSCRNKHTMIDRLTQNGVSTPAHFLVARTDDVTSSNMLSRVTDIGGFPVICKPLMGFASCGVIRADDPQDLLRAIRRIRRNNNVLMARYYDDADSLSQVLVEAYIVGQEVAIDGYVQSGQAHIVSIIDKPDVSKGPYFGDELHILPSSISDDLAESAKQLAQDCVTSIGLDDSPFHLEARISGSKLYVLEIAARIGFMHSIHDALGLDLCAITLALRMGAPPPVTPKRQRFAGNYCITAKRMGFFVRVDNGEAILDDPRIVALPLFVEPGDRVAPPPEGNNYIGYILAAAESYDEVKDALRWAAEEIQVVLE